MKFAIHVPIFMNHKKTFDRIYILDAVNYLFRSYHAIGPMTDSEGRSTGALFGWIRSVLKLCKDFAPQYAVAVFDGPDNKKSRQKVYAEYKMHRKGAPEDLLPQFAWAAKFCELFGLPVVSMEGVEADDAMGSIARWAESQGAQVFLCSGDKDLMQLVGPQISVLHTHKDNLLVDATKVEELYGVRPEQIVDLLAMMGDASDQIPGLEGFGAKTAAALLQEFGSLEEILAHPERVKGEKKQTTLRTQQEIARMSQQLAQIDTSLDVPREIAFYQLREPQWDALAILYRDRNFLSLLRDVPKQLSKGSISYQLVDTEEALDRLWTRLAEASEICIDTETTGVDPLVALCVGIGFGWKEGEAWYVPFNGMLGRTRVVEACRSFFSTSRAAFYGHNLKYDLHVLHRLGISLAHFAFDTLLASYLLNPEQRLHNLDALALERLHKVKIPLESLIGKGKQERSLADVPIEQVKDYCSEDVDCTIQLKQLFAHELKQVGLWKLFHEVELPLMPILAGMEEKGIYLDIQALQKVSGHLRGEIETLRKEILQELGEELNLNSPKQLSDVLHRKVGLHLPKGSTRADVLETLAEEEPIVQKILDYRALEKLRSTYSDALLASVHPITGRIHCTFNQSGTVTGRLSCQDPNLQNIPIRSEIGREIRACFKPQARGWLFLGADYSQIELRLLAHLSQDPELLHAFQEGQDIHAYTASRVFGVALHEVTSAMRAQAKTVNFGILYGQGAYGLSRQLHIPLHEASHFIETYFARYRKVRAYTEECIQSVKEKGFSETLTGRRRPIPEIMNKNPAIRAAAERLAINTPLQGTAADLIKMAMVAIDRAMRKERLQAALLLQIHDELIFEAPESEMARLQEIVKKEMEEVLALSVPLEVQISVGENWGEC